MWFRGRPKPSQSQSWQLPNKLPKKLSHESLSGTLLYRKFLLLRRWIDTRTDGHSHIDAPVNFSSSAPAHSHATRVAVYPALFSLPVGIQTNPVLKRIRVISSTLWRSRSCGLRLAPCFMRWINAHSASGSLRPQRLKVEDRTSILFLVCFVERKRRMFAIEIPTCQKKGRTWWAIPCLLGIGWKIVSKFTGWISRHLERASGLILGFERSF